MYSCNSSFEKKPSKKSRIYTWGAFPPRAFCQSFARLLNTLPSSEGLSRMSLLSKLILATFCQSCQETQPLPKDCLDCIHQVWVNWIGPEMLFLVGLYGMVLKALHMAFPQHRLIIVDHYVAIEPSGKGCLAPRAIFGPCEVEATPPHIHLLGQSPHFLLPPVATIGQQEDIITATDEIPQCCCMLIRHTLSLKVYCVEPVNTNAVLWALLPHQPPLLQLWDFPVWWCLLWFSFVKRTMFTGLGFWFSFVKRTLCRCRGPGCCSLAAWAIAAGRTHVPVWRCLHSSSCPCLHFLPFLPFLFFFHFSLLFFPCYQGWCGFVDTIQWGGGGKCSLNTFFFDLCFVNTFFFDLCFDNTFGRECFVNTPCSSSSSSSRFQAGGGRECFVNTWVDNKKGTTFLSRVDSFSPSFFFFSSSSFIFCFCSGVRKKALTSASLRSLAFLVDCFFQSTFLSSAAMLLTSLCLPLSANKAFLFALVVPLPRGKPLQLVVFSWEAMAEFQTSFCQRGLWKRITRWITSKKKATLFVKGSQRKWKKKQIVLSLGFRVHWFFDQQHQTSTKNFTLLIFKV